MNKISTICFEDVYEFCEAMDSEFNRRYYPSKQDETVDISIFAKYENARKIINILTEYDYELANVNFHDPETDGYEDEFLITLCARISNYDTPEIWVEPAKRKDGFADDLELGNCYDCCCHHDCVDCDMDDEEYVNVTLPKEDIEILHMLCRIFKV